MNATRTFPGEWMAEQEPAQLKWLLGATDAFVNAFRPRVMRLLPRGTAS